MSIIIDATTRLEVVMASTASANNPDCYVAYADYNKENELTRPGINTASLNNVTDVVLLAAPVQNPARQVLSITIYNKDSATQTVTVKIDDGTTERILVKQPLLTTESLVYENDSGWQIL